MFYTIQNDHLKVTVNSLGAELHSIQRGWHRVSVAGQPGCLEWAGSEYFPVCGTSDRTEIHVRRK